MSIKSTYMKIEKDPKGLISQTTQEKAVKILALSHHLCGEVIAELEGLRERELGWIVQNTRKSTKEE